MLVQETLQRFNDRTQPKLAMIEELAHRRKDKPNGPRKTVFFLLQCLHDFAHRQFTFFTRGFSERGVIDSNGESLNGGFLDTKDVIYPLEYALAHTEQQMNHDLDVLLRIIAHRDEHVGTKELRDRLDRADKLAYLALQPAIDNGLITDTSALTYFQKSATVRLIPYAPMALVGVPFTAGFGTAKDNPRDYLMIPHEIGHQVYWRLTKPHQNKPSEQPIWLQNWNEEIFADVYGCLIGGAASARTLQELLKGVPVDVFVGDDGSHPSPIVRPYIHIHVLEFVANAKGVTEEMKKYLTTQTENLRSDWKQWLIDRHIPCWLRPAGTSGTISLPEAEKLVSQVVESILTSCLPKLVESAASLNSKMLWDIQGKRLNVFGLESEINFDALQSDSAPHIEERGDGSFKLSGTSVDPNNSFSPLETKLGFETVREDALTKENFQPPLDRSSWWLEVLEAGGWTEVPTGPGGFKTVIGN